ncbi:hypothetical Protein YC6258_02075 [Gynuella sunshinyii YC6258]|uniref:Uncharacterized protein n=1 Tax=Gynuella sunshinyii YC6258 TaxID=1445510 RepID=A0A0C5VUP8_9GAMM|nr:hypothetical Protein YC6258_02075 [Gynuella sunshinyii YC6258]
MRRFSSITSRGSFLVSVVVSIGPLYQIFFFAGLIYLINDF